jgi:hypothetical protein
LTVSLAVLRSDESKGLESGAGVIVTIIVADSDGAITSVLDADSSTTQLREVFVRPVEISNAAGVVPVFVMS